MKELLHQVLSGEDALFFELANTVSKEIKNGIQTPYHNAIAYYDAWLCLNNQPYSLAEFKTYLIGLDV